MEAHVSILSLCCRIGEEKSASMSVRTKYRVADHTESIFAVVHLNVSKDEPNVHPDHVCHTCKLVMDCSATAVGPNFARGGCRPVKKWEQHSEIKCSVCTPSKPGRKPKRATQMQDKCSAWEKTPSPARTSTPTNPRPTTPVSDMDRTESDVQQHVTPAYQAGKPLQPERFIDSERR